MRIALLAIFTCLLLAGCPSIPSEAPELSAQLGSRLTAMEGAHRKLLAGFFAEKRRRVDDFVQQVWATRFSANLLDDPKIARAWEEVSNPENAAERREFLKRVGTRIQSDIAQKRIELIQPLDELENSLALRLRAEYDQMRAINSTLTAFLQSAAKVEANRKRYLDLIGLTDDKLNKYLTEADSAVTALLEGALSAQASVEAAGERTAAFKQQIRSLINDLKP